MENHVANAPPPFSAPPALPVELVIPIAIWIEVLLYGVNTRLFFESLYIILKKRKTRTRSGKVFFIVIILMYMVTTFNVALGLNRLLRAYVWLRDHVGPASDLPGPEGWDILASTLNFWVMTWLGDALVIYRCFIIWNQRYAVIILPSLLLAFSIVMNIVVMYWFTHPYTISFMELFTWVDVVYLVNLAQNIFTTGLIVFKLLRQHRISTAAGLRNAGPHLRITHVVRILIESALVYTVQLLILIVLNFLRHNAVNLVKYAIVPSMGIVFNLIAVRIHMAESRTAGIPTWMVDHPSTTTELGGTSSHRMDEEIPSIRLKRNGAFAQAESLGRYSGRSRSFDAR